jgi:GT2 family glycosyltransferase
MSSKKIAVVILNWNGIKYLKQFLSNVSENSIDENTDLYVADNGSTDGSVEYIRENFPQIKLILFDKNYGFTGGYNLALKQIEAEIFVLLNSDVEVTPNWLKEPILLLSENTNVAAVMPKILSYNDKKSFEYAGAAGGFIDKFGYPFCRGRIIGEIEQDDFQYEITDEIFWASGAAFFVKADLFLEIGGFDEDFFAHMEEIDLCWRLKNEGYKILYTSKSTVYHVGGGALPNNNPFKIYLNFRNNLYLLLKNLPKKNLFLTIFIRLILDGLSGFVYLASGKFSFLIAVLKAHFAFYRNFSKIYKKRKEISSFKISGIYNKSIVIEYFIKRKRNFKSLNI